MMNQSEKGFTLVELLVAVVVGLIIMAVVYGMMNLVQGSSAGVGRRVLTQQDARAVLDFMALEIGMASYNPTQSTTVFGTVPSTATTCDKIGLASALASRKGIQLAKANSIVVAMDLNGDGVTGSGDNEFIYYVYDSGERKISRNISCGNTEAILGGDGLPTKVVNADAATPVFQYFDATGTDISATVINSPDAAAGGGGIPDIRRIRITIVADVATQDQKFKTTTRTYTTDVLVRNHVLSP